MTAPAEPARYAATPANRFLGRPISPLTRRRLDSFRRNRRGFWSLWIFLAVFLDYPETTFGGEFPTPADYRDQAVQKLISEKGWMLWPPIPFNYSTINYDLPSPAPSPPSGVNWLGTDDQGRDVLARLIYGFRISVLFGLVLTGLSSVIGVAAGAVQGYFGGLIDLGFQRFIEIWSGLL